jgi:uncharacterized membrane protein
MADLIAIGYPDEETAVKAMDEAERLADELVIQPDAIAAIIRRQDGKFRVVTNQHAVAGGATWGAFWGLLFGLLFFVPLLGAALGAVSGALTGKILEAGIDKQFQEEVRDVLQPGTSALFMIVEKMTTDKAIEALRPYGGKVLKSSLSTDVEQAIEQQLQGKVHATA